MLLRVSPSYSGLYKQPSNAQPTVRCSNFVLYMQSAFSFSLPPPPPPSWTCSTTATTFLTRRRSGKNGAKKRIIFSFPTVSSSYKYVRIAQWNNPFFGFIALFNLRLNRLLMIPAALTMLSLTEPKRKKGSDDRHTTIRMKIPFLKKPL